LEALAAIKNPPIVYARQGNIAQGNQQMDNGIGPAGTRARENENEQNKLLEAHMTNAWTSERPAGQWALIQRLPPWGPQCLQGRPEKVLARTGEASAGVVTGADTEPSGQGARSEMSGYQPPNV
jgi:hypothetical protein